MGYKIRNVREARKMSQEELAQASGVSRATISAIENDESGTKNVTTGVLIKLANALGTTIEDLFFAHSV